MTRTTAQKLAPRTDPSTSWVELHALGARLVLDLGDATPEQVERVRALWHLCIAGDDGSGSSRPRVDAGTLSVGDRFAQIDESDPDSESGVLMQLTQDVTRTLIAAQVGRVLMLHAGALAHPETGASIVYVAPGGTGKTTLTRTLGPGLAYLTDETVAITETGEILPYPKPLSIRPAPFRGIKHETAPAALGLRAPEVTPWVAGVVVLRREAPGEHVEAEPVELFDALTMLAPESSSLDKLNRPLHRLAELLDRTGGLRRLHYVEATALAPFVAEVTGRTR